MIYVGNVSEYTMEAYDGSSRVRRGGSYTSQGVEGPIQFHTSWDYYGVEGRRYNVGFRIAIYIK